MRRALPFLVPLIVFAQGGRMASPRPLTPKELAWRVLSNVHLGVGKAQPPVQPYLLSHLAEATSDFNKKLALSEFRSAFVDGRILDPVYRVPLQSQVVTSLAAIDSFAALELARGIRPDPKVSYARAQWDRAILAVDAELLARNKPDEAIEAIKLVSTPGVFPNKAASTLINHLAPADDRRLAVFGYAATCYRQVAFPGFAGLVQDHWQTMPRSVVVMAVDAIADESEVSLEELRAILPALQALDETRAERVLEDHPELNEPKEKKHVKPTPEEREDQRTIKWITDFAAKLPQVAVRRADSISDLDARKSILLQLASNAIAVSGDPEIVTMALDELRRLPEKYRSDLDPVLAGFYSYAGKKDEAKQYVERSFATADKLLTKDLDASSDCGVNPAPRDWWPSTNAYRGAIHAATGLYGMAAQHYLSRIDDADLFLLAEVEFARALMGRPAVNVPVLACPEATVVDREMRGQ